MNTKLENKIESEIVSTIKYVFFGTGPLAEAAIYNLYHGGLIPAAIITKPDATVGRDHVLTAPIIKVWAESKGIKVYQPSTLKEKDLEESTEIKNIDFYKYIKENKIDIAIVASYGKIIPEYILNWPVKGILNIHPSMLPLYRGPSPIESQLLDGLDSIGLSIMKLDAGMDSGPVYIQKSISLNIKNNTNISISSDAVVNTNYNSETIERLYGREGTNMILQILPFVMDGSLKPKDQDESKATFCKFIEKSQGDITDLLNENINVSFDIVKKILNKWRALNPWPGLYFFIDHNEKKLRVKINKINFNIIKNTENINSIEISKFIVEVTPEGKRSMSWESFVNGYYPHPRPLPQGEGR